MMAAANPNGDVKPINSISLSGCGFNSPYLLGSSAAFLKYAPHILNDEKLHILGASAGAMLGACMICKVSLQECNEFICELAEDLMEGWWGPRGMMPPLFNVYGKIRQALEVRLPSNAHELCNGRLHVSLTHFPSMANKMVSEFDSKEELIQALICSGYIFVLGGVQGVCGWFCPKYRGKPYIDGGLSWNSPRLDENTIIVAPFCGENDICPRDDEFALFGSVNLKGTQFCLSMQNAYRFSKIVVPPDGEEIVRMLERGFQDTVEFLALHDLISCAEHVAFHMSYDHCVEVGGDFSMDEKMDGGQVHGPHCRRCHEKQQSAMNSSLPMLIRDRILHKPEPAPSISRRLLNAAIFPWTIPFKIAKKTTSLAAKVVGLPVKTSLKVARTGMNISNWILHLLSSTLEEAYSSGKEKRCLQGVLTCQFDFTRNFEGELFPELSKDLEEASKRSPSFSLPSGSAPQTTRVGIRVSFTYDSIAGTSSRASSISGSSVKELTGTEEPLHLLAGSLEPGKVEVRKVSPRGEVLYKPSSSADMSTGAMAPCQDVLDQLGECLNLALRDDPVLTCSAEDDQGGTACKVFNVEDGQLRSPSRRLRRYRSNPNDLAWDDDLHMVPEDGDFDMESFIDLAVSNDFADRSPRRAASTPNVFSAAGDPAELSERCLGSAPEPRSSSLSSIWVNPGLEPEGWAGSEGGAGGASTSRGHQVMQESGGV